MGYTKSQIIEAKIIEWLKKGGANIEWDSATAKDVMKMSEKLAERYGKLITETFSLESILDDLPELKAVLQSLRHHAADTTRALVEIQNEKNGINIAAQTASDASESIDNLIGRIQDGTILNDGGIAENDKFLLGDNVLKHIADEGVADTLRDNADLASDAGIKTTFIRHLGADGCCKWCQGMAGKYNADNVPKDFWRMHNDCDCWIEYKTDKVRQKIQFTAKNDKGKRSKITTNI